MAKFRKKPVVIEATQWLNDGDHPFVQLYRRPDDDGCRRCDKCKWEMHDHGWIDTLEGGHIVCPRDWIITGVKGEHYPCKPDIFIQTYELVQDANERQTIDGLPRMLHGILVTDENAELIKTKSGSTMLRVTIPNEVDPEHRQDHGAYRYAYYDYPLPEG